MLRRAATQPISQAMVKRAPRRPKAFRKPAHWSDAPPPEPRAPAETPEELSPTRYGDWVKKGVAIDF